MPREQGCGKVTAAGGVASLTALVFASSAALAAPAGSRSPPLGPPMAPVSPALTMPSGPRPVFSMAALPPRLQTVQQLDEAIEGLRQASWQLHSTLGTFKDTRGRTAAQDVDEWLLTPDHEANLEALRATAASQAGSGDKKGLARTLQAATALVEQETYLAGVLTTYWSVQDLALRHGAKLREVTTRLSVKPSAIKAPAVNMIAARLGSDLTQAMGASSPGDEFTDLARLENGRRDLLHAFNEVRANYAAQLSEQDRAQGKEQAVARDTPCPEPVTRTSGVDKPGLAEDNQAPDSFYPDASRQAEFEGSVTIQAWIAASGCMQKAEVYTSSGVPDLDDAAMRWAQQAKFTPAERDQQPVDGVLLFVVKFEMRD